MASEGRERHEKIDFVFSCCVKWQIKDCESSQCPKSLSRLLFGGHHSLFLPLGPENGKVDVKNKYLNRCDLASPGWLAGTCDAAAFATYSEKAKHRRKRRRERRESLVKTDFFNGHHCNSTTRRTWQRRNAKWNVSQAWIFRRTDVGEKRELFRVHTDTHGQRRRRISNWKTFAAFLFRPSLHFTFNYLWLTVKRKNCFLKS